MKLGTKIAVGVLLGIGVPMFLLGTVGALNSKATPGDREGAVVVALLFGLPPTALGSWLLWSNHRRSQQEQWQSHSLALFHGNRFGWADS
jgi:hypothetical protein